MQCSNRAVKAFRWSTIVVVSSDFLYFVHIMTDLLPTPNGNGVPAVTPPVSPTKSIKKVGASAMEETAFQHFTIGDNLRAKAFYQDAIDEFLKAFHIQEPLLGEDSIAVAKTHYALGLSYRAVKNFSQALHHLQKAAAIYEDLDENNGDSHKTMPQYRQEITNCKLNMARTHHSHGVSLQRNGAYDKSILEHRKALAIREHLLGKTHLETARSYYVIGCALSDRGDFDEALAELRRALRTRLLIFGREHMDTQEVVRNLGTVLMAKGSMNADQINEYMTMVLVALDLENEGDRLCRIQHDYANGMVCYRKAVSLEEQMLGELHPTTCDLYLRTADALGELGDLESSLMEYKNAIMIYENLMGKFHVKVATIYNKLAGILMDKGEYETALSFYCKAYGIYDAILGNHPETKQALMNVRLAAAKERNAKNSMDLIKQAEAEFKAHQERQREQEQEILELEKEIINVADEISQSSPRKETKKLNGIAMVSKPPSLPTEDII